MLVKIPRAIWSSLLIAAEGDRLARPEKRRASVSHFPADREFFVAVNAIPAAG
jgi:hypothetical protein